MGLVKVQEYAIISASANCGLAWEGAGDILGNGDTDCFNLRILINHCL